MFKALVSFILLALPLPTWALACGDAHTPIASVQGSGDATPMAGQTVTVEGILTLDARQPGGFQGFYLQQSPYEQDTDPATSEAIFIHTHAENGKPGDRVRVTGKAREYYGLTSLTSVRSITVCGSPGLPQPVDFDPNQTPTDAREPLESMLVQIGQPLVVVDTWNLARFGELVLAPDLQWTATQIRKPATGLAREFQQQDSVRLLLDDGQRRQQPRPAPWPPGGLTPSSPVRIGDQVSQLTGVLDYRFGHWRLQPIKTPVFTHTSPRGPAPERHHGANLRVVSLNLANLFNGNGQGEGFPTSRGARTSKAFQQQQARLAAQVAAMDADILVVSELENDGYDRDSAVAQLTTRLGTHWDFVSAATDTHHDAIRNGLLYRSDRVRTVGEAHLLDQGAFQRWHRPGVSQEFELITGSEPITVVAIHLKSKSCRGAPPAQQDKGDGQACYAAARTGAARELAEQFRDDNGSSKAVLLAGDFNAYAMEAPLQALAEAGYRDLVRAFHGTRMATFRYHGRLGTLDYHLANQTAAERALASHIWAVNVEEPRIFAYDAPKGLDLTGNFLWRASDHNPVITDLKLRPSEAAR